jgi:hypothetical protein
VGLAVADVLEAAADADSGGGPGHDLTGFFKFVVEQRFCRGLYKNLLVNRGPLMVNLWWNAGKRWSENDLISASKNTPCFSDLFLRFPVLGN